MKCNKRVSLPEVFPLLSIECISLVQVLMQVVTCVLVALGCRNSVLLFEIGDSMSFEMNVHASHCLVL